MYLPLNYDQINLAAGQYTPSMVKAYNNQTFIYWFRALYERACSIFEFDLPEHWQGPIMDFFYYCLLRYGYVGIFEKEEYGYMFQPGTLDGYTVYYQPANFRYANPKLGDDTLQIGSEGGCELLKLTPSYDGIFSIIGMYAEKLAALDCAINTSIINSKFSYILAGRNKAAIESLKKIMDKFYRGEPAIYVDAKLNMDRTDKEDPFTFLERSSIKANYITPDQLQDLSTILNNFDKEIGIPTSPYQKAERMTQYESESSMIDSTARAITWKKCLDSSIDIINEHFPGIDLSVKFRYIPDNDPTRMIQEGDNSNVNL